LASEDDAPWAVILPSVVVPFRHAWLAAGLLLAGCYEAFPPSGSPCNSEEADSCPSGLACIRGTCRSMSGGGTDTSTIPDVDAFIPDGSPADLDADGKLNAADNCPSKYNPDQHDEDADGVGDACDNCPHVANANQAATGESATPNGAGDACDPRPGTPGDTIDKFYSFHVPPAGTMTLGTWAVEADAYKVTPPSNGDLSFMVVGGARDKVTVEVAGTLDSATSFLSLMVSVGEVSNKYHECGYLDCTSCANGGHDYNNAFVDYWNGNNYEDLVGNYDIAQRLSGAFTIRVSADSTNARIVCTTTDPRGTVTKQANQAGRLVPGMVGVYSEYGTVRLRYMVVFGQK
jgi:hypothetical protein